MDCNNYRGISLLSTSYKNLSNILLLKMTPSANEIIGEYQYGFRRNMHGVTVRFIKEKKKYTHKPNKYTYGFDNKNYGIL